MYANDHRPAHVHVVGDGYVRFLLGPSPDDVALVEQSGMSKADLRRIAE